MQVQSDSVFSFQRPQENQHILLAGLMESVSLTELQNKRGRKVHVAMHLIH